VKDYILRHWTKWDKNKDGQLDKDELAAADATSMTTTPAPDGLAGCSCVNVDVGWRDTNGSIVITLDGNNGSNNVSYQHGLNLAGGAGGCKAWDDGDYPARCDGPAAARAPWCGRKFCFVDPCQCNITHKVSTYFGNSAINGNPVHLSYATCGENDNDTDSQSCGSMISRLSCAAATSCHWIDYDNAPNGVCQDKSVTCGAESNALSGSVETISDLYAALPVAHGDLILEIVDCGRFGTDALAVLAMKEAIAELDKVQVADVNLSIACVSDPVEEPVQSSSMLDSPDNSSSSSALEIGGVSKHTFAYNRSRYLSAHHKSLKKTAGGRGHSGGGSDSASESGSGSADELISTADVQYTVRGAGVDALQTAPAEQLHKTISQDLIRDEGEDHYNVTVEGRTTNHSEARNTAKAVAIEKHQRPKNDSDIVEQEYNASQRSGVAWYFFLLLFGLLGVTIA